MTTLRPVFLERARPSDRSCLRAIAPHSASAIPAVVSQFSDRGKVSDDQVLPVTVALNFNNEDELDQRIADMYHAGKSELSQFLATGEFKARYAPTQRSDRLRSRLI